METGLRGPAHVVEQLRELYELGPPLPAGPGETGPTSVGGRPRGPRVFDEPGGRHQLATTLAAWPETLALMSVSVRNRIAIEPVADAARRAARRRCSSSSASSTSWPRRSRRGRRTWRSCR